ncbi:unnamed protein product [Boreogadus saida]
MEEMKEKVSRGHGLLFWPQGRAEPTHRGSSVSYTGYGFVDFDSPAAAQKAVASLKASGVQAQMAKVGDLRGTRITSPPAAVTPALPSPHPSSPVLTLSSPLLSPCLSPTHLHNHSPAQKTCS